MFKNLFSQFDCEIIVLNDINDNKLIQQEILNEIISLINCSYLLTEENKN